MLLLTSSGWVAAKCCLRHQFISILTYCQNWQKDFSVKQEWGAQGTVRWCLASRPVVFNRSNSKIERTQCASGKRSKPAPYDKHCECVSGQAQRLVHTPEEWEADTLSQQGENVTGHRSQWCSPWAVLCKASTEFIQRFCELDVMEDIAAFVSNTFRPIDKEQVPNFRKYLVWSWTGCGLFAKWLFGTCHQRQVSSPDRMCTKS